MYMVNNKMLLYILLVIVIYYIVTRIFIHNTFSLNSNIEKFTSNSNISTDKLDAFCNTSIGNGANLSTNCGQLTSDNCKSTSCCVWTSNQQCVAGDASGPTFNTDNNGKTKKLDYYYFENKCYGEKCQ